MRRLISSLILLCLFAFPSLAATSSGCPTTIKNFLAASNVGAAFSNSGNTTTYTFASLTNENPVGGSPGLIKYCVYPSPAGNEPTGHTVAAKGADGTTWLFRQDPKEFGFVRPGGNKTNIPLDGKTTTMGTATFSSLPTSQTIILHIIDPDVCTGLYGSGSPGTCFVKPTNLSSVCNAGEGSTVAAYNAIPFGGVNCGPPSVGVEAYGFNELGDQVTLAGSARQLVSLTVLFTSYGCSVSGHWYSGDCVTNAGNTFDIPITANIYDSAACTIGTPLVCSQAPLATVTLTTPNIPYRPSADNTNCTGSDAGKWFNPLNGPSGKCQYSIGKLLTFNFPAGTELPGNVIWTVAYNTSHSGYNPIAVPLGPGAACEASGGPGCGYDSLNVGVMSYPDAPYAGTDDSESVVFINWWQGGGVPQYPSPFGFGVLTPPVGVESTTDAIISGWVGYRPLGEIITKP